MFERYNFGGGNYMFPEFLQKYVHPAGGQWLSDKQKATHSYWN